MALNPLIPDPNAAPDIGLAPIASISMPSAPPTLPPTLKPLVTSPRVQQEQSLRDKINSFENPNKPQGFWQKLGHVSAQIGNIAGDIAAPGTMALIHGTQLNNQIQHGQNARELQGLENQDRQEQDSSVENAMRSQQTAQSAATTAATEQATAAEPAKAQAALDYQNAQISALLHPKAKTDFEAWQQQNPGKPISEWLQLQNTNKPGNDFDKFYKDYITENQLPDSAHNRTLARKEWAAASQAPQRAPQITIVNPQGQVQTLHSGDSVAPGSTTVAGMNTQTLNTNKEQVKSQKAAQDLIDEVSTAHTLAKEAEAGNAPADVDLALAFFKTMKGSGSGIRFTQAEQNLIMGARNSAGDLTAMAQKVIGGGQKFTPEQRNNILRVMDIHAKAAQGHLSGDSGQSAGSNPNEGDTKTNSHGDKIKFSGGKWGPA